MCFWLWLTYSFWGFQRKSSFKVHRSITDCPNWERQTWNEVVFWGSIWVLQLYHFISMTVLPMVISNQLFLSCPSLFQQWPSKATFLLLIGKWAADFPPGRNFSFYVGKNYFHLWTIRWSEHLMSLRTCIDNTFWGQRKHSYPLDKC